MIISMTGYGKAEGDFGGRNYSIELRSVNNRFCEISFKYPRYMSSRDFQLKDIVKKKISRGKINASLMVKADGDMENMAKVNTDAAKYYYSMLDELRKATGIQSEIGLDQLLKFSDVMDTNDAEEVSNEEFDFIASLLNKALDDVVAMKLKEGSHIREDLLKRIEFIGKETGRILEISEKNKPEAKEKLAKKVETIMGDKTIIDEKRLEMELVLLSDKLDISEECTRLDSHLKYFGEYIDSEELAGRRLVFLVQEMNREVNTIASKSMSAEISQSASVLKEELEKIREQLQNVE
ncbi:MAG: YicC family protein [Ignavibacteriae bacterium]|nr:YicC family protein [Ignavibacteriota bacterium]MCB9242580.1 YicC family protein [Ignavibacteriales bacterium]